MKVKEIGNLTADPTYGENNSKKYCNFTIAINNPFNKDDVEYVRVSAFGKTAESCRDYLQKGSQIQVEGRVKINSYPNKETGEMKYNLGVNAKEVMFLNKIKQRDDSQNNDEKSKIDQALKNSNQNQSSDQQKSTQGMAI